MTLDHPFSQLAPEYAAYLSRMSVTPSKTGLIDSAAKRILWPENLDVYQAAVEGTAIPAAFVGVLELRESNCDPLRALGQGDRWDHVSVNVPRGQGPFASRLAAMKFYIHYDHLDQNSAPWSMEYACWKGEAWNGFGPRGHGRPTGYLWAGTSIYDKPYGPGGKYVSDGKWSSTTWDIQLGIVPVLLRIAQLRPDLAIGTALPNITAPSIVPAPVVSPSGVGGDVNKTKWIQSSLNKVLKLDPPLMVDGSFGRMTRNAVHQFQVSRHLVDDGIVGAEVTGALTSELAKMGVSDKS